jgi:hypothetical protein
LSEQCANRARRAGQPEAPDLRHKIKFDQWLLRGTKKGFLTASVQFDIGVVGMTDRSFE